MAYDEPLAERIRDLLAGEAGLTEQRMFGGLAFLIGGHMAVAASGQGLMVRVNPADLDTLLETTGARPMEMRGRAMRGWLRVDGDEVQAEHELAGWVERGTAFARSLPPKSTT